MNWNKRFAVLSSDGQTIYHVDFLASRGQVAVRCSCPAGIKGKFCKHKYLLLKSHSEILFEPKQINDLNDTLFELRDHAVFHELGLLLRAEAEHEAAVDSLNAAKKRLETVLRGE